MKAYNPKHCITAVITDWAAGAELQQRPLTSGWHCVPKHLVELAEVHDHGELVRFHHRRHLLASHAWRDAKLPLGHVKSQLVVLLVVFLVQGLEITEPGGEQI